MSEARTIQDWTSETGQKARKSRKRECEEFFQKWFRTTYGLRYYPLASDFVLGELDVLDHQANARMIKAVAA